MGRFDSNRDVLSFFSGGMGLGRAIGQVFLSVADGTAAIETKRLRGTDVHEKLKRAMALGQCERSVKE